jgi:hypothetical protein
VTAKNPAWIDGVAVSGQELRLALGALFAPNGPLVARSGVRPGDDLLVTALGTPNMSVNVAAGQAVIQGTESGTQGAAIVTNDGTVNLAIAAADATNGRRDLIVARWYSETVALASRRFALEVVTGSPAASPVDPTLPANSIVLARVTVAAAAASIAGGAIADLRAFTAAAGGVLPCLSTDHPATPYEGMSIYELDKNRTLVWDGTQWLVTWDSGNWVALAAATGYTSSASHRVVGTMLEFKGSISKNAGAIPTGDTAISSAGALPVAARPATARSVVVTNTNGGSASGQSPSVNRLDIYTSGTIELINNQQASITQVWLDGVRVSLV